jgi:hypothetical protein
VLHVFSKASPIVPLLRDSKLATQSLAEIAFTLQ